MGNEQHYIEVRNRTVRKANELIQQSRFSLSLQQQKIILYLISQISPTDEDFKLYEFSIMDFCRVCGIEEISGRSYRELKAAIKEIADKSLWVEIAEDEETLLRWIEKPYINKQDGVIKIRLDNDMKPFLLQLRRNYTQYELLWTLNFKSKYTIRLYELVKSVHYNDDEVYIKEYSLDELRRLLDAEKYTRYQNFKQRVLDTAIEEINRYSDKTVSYETIKAAHGKCIDGIRFTIGSKDTLERIRIRSEIEHKYDLNQLTLWDRIEAFDSKRGKIDE